MQRLLLLLAAVGSMIIMPAAASATLCDSLQFDVSAELTTDPGFEGMYKYTINGYWEVSGVEQGWGLSHIIFSIGPECPCICDETTDQILFPEPPGTSTGIDSDTEEECESIFQGVLECSGLEDITTDVVVKYEVLDGQSCEPVHYGSGTWIFYSTIPPLPEGVYLDTIIIKYGEMFCNGSHQCEPPDCFYGTTVSGENTSWGTIKFIFE